MASQLRGSTLQRFPTESASLAMVNPRHHDAMMKSPTYCIPPPLSPPEALAASAVLPLHHHHYHHRHHSLLLPPCLPLLSPPLPNVCHLRLSLTGYVALPLASSSPPRASLASALSCGTTSFPSTPPCRRRGSPSRSSMWATTRTWNPGAAVCRACPGWPCPSPSPPRAWVTPWGYSSACRSSPRSSLWTAVGQW